MAEDGGKVTLLSEYFYPEEASTAQLLTELSVHLADSYSVSVVASQPSYHDGDESQATPRSEQYEGVNIRRVRATRFDKDSLLGRLVNWLTFTVSAFFHLLLNKRDADVNVVLSNPPILPFAAATINRIYGTPYVYVVHDMYPDMPIALGYLSNDGILARIWERLMRILYRDADRIVVLGEAMRDRFEAKMADDPSFDPAKIEVIENWENGNQIQPIPKSENEFAQEQGLLDTFTVLYSGNIGRFHDLETTIDAIGLLEERGHSDVELVVIGDGARKEEHRARVARKEIDGVRFLPFQPRDRLSDTLTCGDISLVGIKQEVSGMCVSSKLYSALAAGSPILAVVGPKDQVARTVKACDCGEHVSPGNPSKVADVIEHWMDNPEVMSEQRRNARDCFEANYTFEDALDTYDRLLKSTIGSPPA